MPNKEGHADYMRKWRATVGPRKIRAAYHEGIAEGVERACNLMRTLYGEQSLTGFAAAHAIAKTLMTIKPG
jgi:hypothetical protein